MSDHSTTLVPLETWSYHNPRLARTGVQTDLGGLAEALVYYDKALVNFVHPRELEALVQRFASEGLEKELIRLFKDGTLRPHYFAFHSAPVGLPDGSFQFLNLQGPDQAAHGSFDLLILSRAAIDAALPKSRHRRSLLDAVRKDLVEVKGSEFGAAIDSARADCFDEERAELLVQAWLDDIHDLAGMRNPPSVRASVSRNGDTCSITWHVETREGALNLQQIAEAAGDRAFRSQTPASAAIQSNRLIWAAARRDSDLLVGQPLSQVVGDKLYEVATRATRIQHVVESLKEEVEFPDVRALVNERQIGFREVLKLRSKGDRFRRWLQSEADRDRNAIIAYHNEVARESGFTRVNRRALQILSVVGGTSAGGVVGTAATGVSGDSAIGAAIGAAAGAGVKFLLQHASRFDEGWKPVMFGNWAKARIERAIEGRRRP